MVSRSARVLGVIALRAAWSGCGKHARGSATAAIGGDGGAISSGGAGGAGGVARAGTGAGGESSARAVGGSAAIAGGSGRAGMAAIGGNGGDGMSGSAAVSGSGGAGAGAGAGGGGAAGGGDVIVTIDNGDYWLDTDGKRIEAHGAGLIYTEGAWYWIGEDKSGNSASFKAVNCYRSTDLSHWEFRRAIITPKSSNDLAASDRIIERPKVIYNETTKKYVMWLHWEGMNYGTAEAGVFTSDHVDGEYTQVRHFRPNNNMSRDDALFKDDDGKAYFLSAANNNADSALYELTDDYTDMKRQITTLWAGSYRQAPEIMKAAKTYFIVNSGATNWDPNQQKYATASAMDGSWSGLSNVGDSAGFDTQTAFIITLKGTKTTTYIYAGDRWQDPDLGSSKYIWLPLQVNGPKLTLDNYDSWKLNVTTGEWSH
jgi:hypothetical protein